MIRIYTFSSVNLTTFSRFRADAELCRRHRKAVQPSEGFVSEAVALAWLRAQEDVEIRRFPDLLLFRAITAPHFGGFIADESIEARSRLVPKPH